MKNTEKQKEAAAQRTVQQPPGSYFVFAERKRSEFQRDEGAVLLGHGDRGGDRQHLIPVI